MNSIVTFILYKLKDCNCNLYFFEIMHIYYTFLYRNYYYYCCYYYYFTFSTGDIFAKIQMKVWLLLDNNIKQFKIINKNIDNTHIIERLMYCQ